MITDKMIVTASAAIGTATNAVTQEIPLSDVLEVSTQVSNLIELVISTLSSIVSAWLIVRKVKPKKEKDASRF